MTRTRNHSVRRRPHPRRRRRGPHPDHRNVDRHPGHETRRHAEAVAEGPPVEISGVVDLLPSGSGFVRQIDNDLLPSDRDFFLPASLIREKRLRTGMLIRGQAQSGARNAVTQIDEINLVPISEFTEVVPFDKQISIDPGERYQLTPARTPEAECSMRFVELMTPIGKGQRALIVAPPKTGKTMLLHDLAASVADHHPEVFLIVLLVDERPEEVTHFKRSVRGAVVASSSDREAASHLRVAKLTLELARNLAESGRDVFLLLDSITRLGRACNREEGARGKTMSGGIGARALEFPRRFFGSARNLEHGGSLTIVGTALIDTGSRMDEVIFQEFKGTGNMELVLDRRMADRRIFPAVDLNLSGTRKEEKILPPPWLNAARRLRRHLATLPSQDAMEVLIERLMKAESTDAFCSSIA